MRTNISAYMYDPVALRDDNGFEITPQNRLNVGHMWGEDADVSSQKVCVVNKDGALFVCLCVYRIRATVL